MTPPPPRSTLFPYTTLFRSSQAHFCRAGPLQPAGAPGHQSELQLPQESPPELICPFSRWAAARPCAPLNFGQKDRKSTRLNSSHPSISYAVFCLKKKKIKKQ